MHVLSPESAFEQCGGEITRDANATDARAPIRVGDCATQMRDGAKPEFSSMHTKRGC